MKKLAIAGAALFAMSLPSFAADLPVRAPIAAPVPIWSGFYAGVNAGVQWLSDGGFIATPADAASAAFWGPCNVAGACPRVYGSEQSLGVMGGAQIGYNFMVSPTVLLGIEVDIQGTGASANRSAFQSNIGTGFLPFTATSTTDLDWLATLRARLGVLVTPNVLAYVTGGGALGGVDGQAAGIFTTAAGALNSNTLGSFSDTRSGWTVGAGAEWMLAQRWILGVEYLYVRLGDTSFATSAFAAAGGSTPANSNFNVVSGDLESHIARVKLNYKF